MSDVPPKNPYDSPQAPSAPPVSTEPTSDDKLFALLAHLSGFLVPVIGALIIWLIKKDESEFIEDQGREAMNFQLSVLIVAILSIPTCIGPLVVQVGGMVYFVIAALESNKGIKYRYPYTFRMIK